MEFLPTYKLEPSFFKDVHVGTEFVRMLRGFRPAKDYWIGVCVLRDIKEVSENGEILHGCVDFIFCKKSEKSLADLFNLKQQAKEKSLKLTFKGMSAKEFPIFFHKFIYNAQSLHS